MFNPWIRKDKVDAIKMGSDEFYVMVYMRSGVVVPLNFLTAMEAIDFANKLIEAIEEPLKYRGGI